MKIKKIVVQTADYLALQQILLQVQEAIKDGWVVPDTTEDRLFPKKFAPGYYEIPLVKNEPELTSYEADMKCLEILTKKDELLEFAEQKGITVPEHIKIPSAICKYLKRQLTNKAEGGEYGAGDSEYAGDGDEHTPDTGGFVFGEHSGAESGSPLEASK